MKRISLAILLALCTFSGAAVAEPSMRVGVDGAFILPVGNWGDVSGMGFGGLARFEYGFMKELTGTFRAGYLFHLKKNDMSTAELPILLGAKYFFLGNWSEGGLYGALEVGMTRLTAEASFAGVTASNSEFKFGTTVGAGYEIANIDIRAQLYAPSFGDFTDFMGVLVTVGYSFVSF